MVMMIVLLRRSQKRRLEKVACDGSNCNTGVEKLFTIHLTHMFLPLLSFTFPSVIPFHLTIHPSIHHTSSYNHSSIHPSPSTYPYLHLSIHPSSHHAHLQDIQLHKDLRGPTHLWRPHSGSEGVHHGDWPPEDSDWGRYWGGWDNINFNNIN